MKCSRSDVLACMSSLMLLIGCGDDDNPVRNSGDPGLDPTICLTNSEGLMVIEADSSAARILVAGDSLTSPRWSPAKTTIAFVRNRELPLGNQLRAVDSAGSVAVTLSSGIREFSGDPWSPDGKRLVVIDRDYGLNIVTPSGPPPSLILPNMTEAVFLTDSALVCSRMIDGHEDRTEIVRVVLADTSITVLASDSAGTSYSPRVSRDGRRIAFARSELGEYDAGNEVWVINSDGQGLKRIAGSAQGLAGGRIRELQFSDDGGSLAVLADADEQTTVFVVRLNGGTVTDLHVVADDGSGSMAWSPDGKYIVYGVYDGGIAIVNLSDHSVMPLSATGSGADW